MKVNATRIAERIHGRKVALEIMEVVGPELTALSDDAKAAAVEVLTERIKIMARPAEKPAEPNAAKVVEKPSTAVVNHATVELPPDVERAIAMVEEIESLARDLPFEGEDFGVSVCEKASDIAANVERHQRVTEGQFSALENMLGGLQRWFHN